jgi:hypothetical protein
VLFLKKLATTPLILFAVAVFAANPQLSFLNDPVDVSRDFRNSSNFNYVADQLASFGPATHMGRIIHQRSQYSVRHTFNNDLTIITTAKPNEFPKNECAANPSQPFSIESISCQ